MKKQKFALVLSGGGFKGAFQLGALDYIQRNWQKISGSKDPMKFDIVAGVSVGALNGALISMNELDKLKELWLTQIAQNGVSEIYTSEIIDTSSKEDKIKVKIDLKSLAKRLLSEIDLKMNLFKGLGVVFSKEKRNQWIDSMINQVESRMALTLSKYRSIASNDPLRDKLKVLLNRGKIKDTNFLCGFVSLDTGNYHGVLHKDFLTESDFVNGVLASTSMPMIWEPVNRVSFTCGNEITISKNNVDGGLRNVSPLGDVIKLINEDHEESEYKIIVINCSSGNLKPQDYTEKSIASIAFRSLYEIAITEVFNNDVDHFLKINRLVKQAKFFGVTLFNETVKPLKAFDAVIINPAAGFDMGNPLVANEGLIHKRLLHGTEMAKRAFSKM